MHRSSTARLFVLLSLATLPVGGALAACGGGDDSSAPSTDDAGNGNDASNASDTSTTSDGGASDAASTDASVDAGAKITVSGHVLGDLGEAASASVMIGGHLVLTDATGAFSFSDVIVPYAVYVAPQGSAPVHVYGWEGLTAPAPALHVPSTADPKSATLSGTFTGGHGFPQAAGTYMIINSFGGPTAAIGGTGVGTGFTGAYNFPLEWSPQDGTESFSIYALQYQTSPLSIPSMYYALGRGALGSVSNGQSVTKDIVLDGIATHTITVTSSLPGSATSATTYSAVYAVAANAAAFNFVDTTGAVPSQVHVPAIMGGVASLAVDAKLTTGESLVFKTGLSLVTDSSIAFAAADFPAPPTVTSPVNGSSGFDLSSPFTISTSAGAYGYLLYASTTKGTGPTLQIFSTTPTFHVPDTAAFGMTASAGATYGFIAESFTGTGSFDDTTKAKRFAPTSYAFTPLQSVTLK